MIVFAAASRPAAILFLHRANLRRLRAGTESRFNFGRRTACVGSLLAVTLVAALWLAPGAFAAWCGSGETATDRPDTVTAQQVHAVVAIPSDAPDTFADNANQVADDVTSMVGWWAGQDPTRIPRFDQALFDGSQCLDISFVRLPDPASAFASVGAGPGFQRIVLDLIGAGLRDIYKKYLVYFEDRPSRRASAVSARATSRAARRTPSS